MTRESAVRVPVEAIIEIEDEIRARLAQQVLSACDEMASSGLFSASAGEVSVRIPDADSILITPHVPFVQQLTPRKLLEITLDGRILRKRARPSISAQMHLEICKWRPDVKAVVHCHAAFAIVLSICDLPIPPVTFGAIPFSDVPRVSADTVATHQWPHEVAVTLADGAPAALLCHDGMVTVGVDLEQAVSRALALEDTARILTLAHLLQKVPRALPPEVVEVLKQVQW